MKTTANVLLQLKKKRHGETLRTRRTSPTTSRCFYQRDIKLSIRLQQVNIF